VTWGDHSYATHLGLVPLDIHRHPHSHTHRRCDGCRCLWVDWLLLKLDRSRADRRKNFGHEMVNLHFAFNALRSQGRDPMRAKKQELKSCFVSAKKFGVWAPDDQVFNLDPDIAENLIAKYLSNVGTKLKDGHFGKAKQAAEKSKAAFTAAYAGR